jgi:hypothetical protein
MSGLIICLQILDWIVNKSPLNFSKKFDAANKVSTSFLVLVSGEDCVFDTSKLCMPT